MTPQERQLIDDLFDRLAKLENGPRDPEAMSAIMQGLRNAPNAVYALVQTTLVQDEALKRANDRIQQLESGHAGEQNQSGGFLDSMRDSIFGQSQPQSSVPNVRAPGVGGRPVWNTGEVMQQAQGPGGQGPGSQGPGGPGQYNQGGLPPGYGQQPAYGQPYGAPQQPGPGGGGSFLGTAAAAAAGMVGGSLLLGSIRSMMGGGGHQQSFGDSAGLGGSNQKPWSDQSNSDLARDAGINDIGSGGKSRGLLDNNSDGDSSRAGLFDSASNDDHDHDHDDTDHDSDGFDGDGDSDYA